MKCQILFIILISFTLWADAQTIKNIWAIQKKMNIIIVYDLSGNDDNYSVRLYCSTDGGGNWNNHLTAVYGDVGAKIKTGKSKKIEWRVLDEKEKLTGTNIVFKISASPDEIRPSANFNKINKVSLVVYEQNTLPDQTEKVIEPAIINTLRNLKCEVDPSGSKIDSDFKISITTSVEKGTLVNDIHTAFVFGSLEIFDVKDNAIVFNKTYDRVSGGHLLEAKATLSAQNNLKDLINDDLTNFFNKQDK